MRHQQPPPPPNEASNNNANNSEKQQEIEDIWKQVRQLQNQTATHAREYQDVKASQKEITGPQETAAERYQHRQVQNDFDKIRKSTSRINASTEGVIFKESEGVCTSLEAGIQHLTTEKTRLEARLKELNQQTENMQNEFEVQLQKLDEQRKVMKRRDDA